MGRYQSICFVYPDDGQSARFDRMYPPLGLELVAAGVRDRVRDRTLIDLRFEQNWEQLIPENTDLVALSLLWEMPLARVFGLVRTIKRLRPGVTVVAGGRAAETNREALVSAPADERVDVVFSGPDDGRFREFVTAGLPDFVPGASFVRDGAYHQTPMPPNGPIPDLPLPDRSLRRVRYGVIRKDGFDFGFATDAIQTSRGCPFNCAFCTFNRDLAGRHIGYTARSPESVADELEEIEAPFVIFVDDLAFHRPDRMEQLCDILLERGIRKKFWIETRINMGMRPQTVEKMARAGFRYVQFGLESMHDHVLDFLNKGYHRKQIEKAFSRIRHVPIVKVANFIIGSVGETREEMLQIPDFARKIGLDGITIHPLRCRGPEPLAEKVIAAPGYHIHPDSKRVYSDELSVADISTIAKQIKRDFWTPARRLKTIWKMQRLMLGPLDPPAVATRWAWWKLHGAPDPWGNRPSDTGSPPQPPLVSEGVGR